MRRPSCVIYREWIRNGGGQEGEEREQEPTLVAARAFVRRHGFQEVLQSITGESAHAGRRSYIEKAVRSTAARCHYVTLQ